MTLEYIELLEADTKYPCIQCEYKATTQGSLKKHILSVHQKIKYPCNQCDYKATTQGSLKKHIESIHEEVKFP